MDIRKSKAVPLLLIGSMAVFFGFKTCYSHHDDDDYDRSYYADPSTRPRDSPRKCSRYGVARPPWTRR